MFPTPQPRPELIEGLFREAQLITVAGTFGAGKSPMLVEWAFCLTTGLSWCNRKVQPRPVIMLAHETPDWAFWECWASLGERYHITPSQDRIEMFLEAGSEETEATTELLNVLSQPIEKRMAWLEAKVASKPDAVVFVDPFNMFFPVDTKKGAHVMVVYKWCRMLHRKYPGVTFVFSFNTRKKSRMAKEKPSLLKDARDWLEEASGGLEIQSRSDVRLGLEYLGDPADRLFCFNGWRRGEDMEPLLLESVILGDGRETKPRLAGFQVSTVKAETLDEMLTERQGEVWRTMAPGPCSIAELVGMGLPRSSAYNMRARLLRLGLVKPLEDGMFLKEAE